MDMTKKINLMVGVSQRQTNETAEDFQETLRIVRETKPDFINISRFWSRPGTPAAKLKQVDGREAADRCRILMELFKEKRCWIFDPGF